MFVEDVGPPKVTRFVASIGTQISIGNFESMLLRKKESNTRK